MTYYIYFILITMLAALSMIYKKYICNIINLSSFLANMLRNFIIYLLCCFKYVWSAYSYRLISSNWFKQYSGLQKYRQNATLESLKNGDDVTFREFVDFITDNSENGTRNEHWRPINELCHPCIINYNLVSKYESLVEDATEILERIGVTSIR